MTSEEIVYRMDLDGVDWEALTETLRADAFDNGRTPEQLRRSFERSYASVIAWAGGQVIGTARVLSDGVCNAYVVDVWTLSPYRRRGVGHGMMQALFARLQGQHVYLFTDEATEFYRSLGFAEQGVGLGRVVGKWLEQSA